MDTELSSFYILESNDVDEMFYYYNHIIESDEFINNQIIYQPGVQGWDKRDKMLRENGL